jgi:hypothetical protein
MIAVVGVMACAKPQGPQILSEHDWAGKGQWLRADTHMHSRLSDGSQDVLPLVAKAVENGCQVVAVADHADRQLRGATPEYMTAIAEAKAAHPDLIVIPALEWNVPPSGGDEHATLLVPDDPGAGQMLAEFKKRFDDYDRNDDAKPTVQAALEWLTDTSRRLPEKPVVIYNHPSRKDTSSLSNADDMINWRKGSDIIIGFEGGPGHQGKAPYGAYKKLATVDRWDPVVATPGDAWDKLFQQEIDVHGAIASSDFHNDSPNDLNDYWPCQFAETWYYVPEKTVNGVLKAMRAGTFFGVHGHIVQGLELTVLADGMTRPAMVGEKVRVNRGTEVVAMLTMDIPETDWAHQPNHIDAAEFIVITPSGVETKVHQISGVGSQAAAERFVVGPEGLVVRARVRRKVPGGTDLMAYTNAIRIIAR